MAIYTVTDFLKLSKYSGQAPELLKRITSDNEKIDTFTSSINERMEAVEEVIATVSTANIEALTERVDALEHKVNAQGEQLDTLNTLLDEHTDELADHESRIKALEESQEVQDELIDELETTTAELKSQQDINTSSISALETRLTADEELINANAEDITILAQQVQTNAENINRIFDDIPVDDLVELSERVTAVETALTPSAVQIIGTHKGLTLEAYENAKTVYLQISGTTNDAIELDEVIATLEDYKPVVEQITNDMTHSIIGNLTEFSIDTYGIVQLSGRVLQLPAGTTINQLISSITINKSNLSVNND